VKGLKELIKRNISGKKVLLLFMLTNLIYIFMLAVTIPKTMEFSKGLKLLDMMPGGYNSEYIKNLFSTLGEEGRSVYLYNQIPIDMLYPGLFAISYCLVMAFFLQKLQKLDTGYFYLTLIPFVAGIADYSENFGIITILNNYPDVSQLSMVLTNIFTIVKSTVTAVYFVALIITMAIFGFKTFNKRK